MLPALPLCATMRNGLALESLGLEGCSLDDDEIAALAAGFRHCPTLRRLLLRSNDFSTAGEAALATGIAGHSGLTVGISSARIDIGDAGLAALAPAQPRLRPLRLAALAAPAAAPDLMRCCSRTARSRRCSS
jgi:hypothetical protein